MKNKIIALIVLLNMAFPPALLAASFSDVSESNPYYKSIEFLKTEGIIGGYPDGTFKPEQVVNRAEALKMILNAKKTAVNEISSTSFKDIATADWFAKYVETAKTLGIVNGNPDGTFAPGRNVNKVEFLKMLLLTYEVKFVNYQPPEKPLYPDAADSKQWFIPYLDFAKNVNLISPNSAGNIEPSKDLTRGEVAEIIYKLVIIIKGGPVQLLLSRAESAMMQSIYDLQKGDISSATGNIANAKKMADEALQKAPDQSIVKAAAKIIEAFESLIKAFNENSAKQTEAALKSAGLAYNLAEEAKNINPGIENLSTQVKNAAKSLADSIRANQGQ